MDFNGYKRTKKFDIKRWFKGTNSIVYLVILVVMVLGLLFVLRTVISMHNSNKNADNVSQEETTGETDSSETDTQTQTIAKNQSYYIRISIAKHTLIVYQLDDNKEFTKRYLECEQDPNLHGIEVPALDMMKKIMRSAVETGTPFIFFRDTVNAANPNKHAGMIYASNLCHEIAQNVGFTNLAEEIINEDGTITTKTNTGDMVTCNLNSISLGRITDEELEENIALQIRMLDNVISINQAPVPESRMTSDKYRAIGLGTSGYHHYLVNHDIQWESDEHIEVADKLFENIAFYAIKASMELAKEKGAYPAFKGSEWETGEYFTRRGYTSDRWKQLAADVAKYGIRNGYLMAVAPTGSTSNIFTPKTAPDLNDKTFWLYKEAHTIDQQWSIKACGVRQRHIDQAQSFNLYITPQMKAKEILDLYVEAYKQGIKTIYYIRNQSLEMDECTSCSS